MSNTFGSAVKLTIFGQSHSAAIGFSLDSFPAGVSIDMDELNLFMARRSPGKSEFSTSRREKDELKFLCGIVNGKTCGSPIAAIILNKDVNKSDYEELKNIPRPGHADITAQIKYGGFQDKTGGGSFSGRLTAPLCAAGALCIQLLKLNDIEIAAHIKAIHGVLDEEMSWDGLKSIAIKSFPTISDEVGERMRLEIAKASSQGDSVGGIIECMILGMPAGVGEPVFNGMENIISQAVFAIPAVKGIEFGVGFGAADMYGSENNDEFYYDDDKVKTFTNNSGGILGGITNGMPLCFSCVIKPTPSIAKPQRSVDLKLHKDVVVRIKGRHDPAIVPRAVPCIEAAAALAVTDALIDSGFIWKGSIKNGS